MALLAELEQTWKGVELAAKGGHVVNQTMLAFVWWKELQKLRPDLHITYETGTDSITEYQPNLIIWQDAGTPSVLFAGEVKFFDDESSVSEATIAKLRHLEQAPNLAVPMRDTKSGEVTRHRIPKSENFILGLFIVAHLNTVATVWAALMQGLTEPGRARNPFAFGAISTHPIVESLFRSLPPGESND